MSNTSASPISTGGAGNNYEHAVQAAYLLYMMAGHGVSCFPSCKINSMRLQGMYAGYHTDDCILFLEHTQTHQQYKLLAQIKMTARITAGDEEFRKSIEAAWKDFNDTSGELFNKEHDRIALITSHLNQTEHQNVLPILSWAKHSKNAEDFLLKMEKVSSKEKKEKLDVFRNLLCQENGGTAVSDEILWQFLKCYEIIPFDDKATRENLEGLIRRACDTETPDIILMAFQQYVADVNPNAGTITPKTLPESLRHQFRPATAKLRDAWRRLETHGNGILRNIETDVSGIHIDRSGILDQILEVVPDTKFTFLTGSRGTGKSALMKDYCARAKGSFQIICLRAEDFHYPSLEAAMFTGLGVSLRLDELFTGLSLSPRLLFVIESIEKILEFDNKNTFQDFLSMLHEKSSWRVLATCRDYAVKHIEIACLASQEWNYREINVPDFSDGELRDLQTQSPQLSRYSNEKLKQLIKNPFMAQLASKIDFTPDLSDSIETMEKEFKEAVWRECIARDSVRKNGMNDKRRRTFVDIAVRRVKSRSYTVSSWDFETDVLTALESDDLISFYENRHKITLKHDVLEDWALESFIESNYQSNILPEIFLATIGSERGILRGFRLWLVDKINFSCDEITTFITKSLESESVSSCWKDEILIAILTGRRTHVFLPRIHNRLIVENGSLYSRLCLLLGCACIKFNEEISTSVTNDSRQFIKSFPFLNKPQGDAWGHFIRFVMENKGGLLADLMKVDSKTFTHTIRILKTYAGELNDGQDDCLARTMVEFSIEQLEELIRPEDDEKFRFNDENEDVESLIDIIITLCQFNKERLESFVLPLISETDHRKIPSEKEDVIAIFLRKTLMEAGGHGYLCKHMPDLVQKLMWYAIKNTRANVDDQWGYFRGTPWESADAYGVYDKIQPSDRSGVGDFHFPSGIKGPFWSLLRFHWRKGIDFILDLLNYSAEKYYFSQYEHGEKFIVDLPLNDGRIIKQYCSPGLWFAYRENIKANTPGVIKTALMALERFLLELLEDDGIPSEVIANITTDILSRSKSVMPTAVLASLATGFYKKFLQSALPFLRVKEFFDLDFKRAFYDTTRPSLADFGLIGLVDLRDPMRKSYIQERREAGEKAHRKMSIFDLAGLLQFTPCQEEVLKIIEQHQAGLTNILEENNWKIRLYKMDLRNAEVRHDVENRCILLTSKNPPDFVETPEQIENNEFLEMVNRLTRMHQWALSSLLIDSELPTFFPSPQILFSELKSLYEMSEKNPDQLRSFWEAIPVGCAILIKRFREELDEETFHWCWEIVVRAILEIANDRKVLANGCPGIFDIVRVLPTLVDMDDKEAFDDLKQFLSYLLVVSQNPDIQKRVGIAISNYIWPIDPSFAEHCLRGTFQYIELAKKYYHTIRHTEEEYSDFLEACKSIQESIMEKTTAPLPENIIFSPDDTWDLFTILNMIPLENTSALHYKILDAAATLFINLQDRRFRNEGICFDFEFSLPDYFTNHCFSSEKNIAELSFIKILLNNIPDSLPIFTSLFHINPKPPYVTKFFEMWETIAQKIKPHIIQWSNDRNRSTQKEEEFLTSLLRTTYLVSVETNVKNLFFRFRRRAAWPQLTSVA